jgi:hypothetical protein
VFEFVETSFDAVALLVKFAVVRSLEFAVAFRRDNRSRTDALRLCHERIGIVTSIGDDSFGLLAGQQLCG